MIKTYNQNKKTLILKIKVGGYADIYRTRT